MGLENFYDTASRLTSEKLNFSEEWENEMQCPLVEEGTEILLSFVKKMLRLPGNMGLNSLFHSISLIWIDYSGLDKIHT